MARDFNGTTGYLEYSGAGITATPLTMACWFNSDSIAAAQCLMSICVSGGSHRFMISANGDAAGDPCRAYTIDAGIPYAESTTGYTASTWYHCAGVFASTTSRAIYLNGGSKGTNATSATPAGLNRTIIGARISTTYGAFTDGRIAYPCYWNVALTDDEVVSLASGIHPSFIRPASIVYCPDIEGYSSPEYDPYSQVSFTVNGTAPQADNPPKIILPFSEVA